MLTIPKILDTPEFYDAPLDYKWTQSIENGLTERVKGKLFDAICPLNHKAQKGIALAMAEFIFWRIHKFCEKKEIDLSVSFSLIEAYWTGIIDHRYAISCPPLLFDIEPAKLGGVIENADAFLSYTATRYLHGSYFTYESVPSIITLARHIAPDKDWFDGWFTDIHKRAEKLFPIKYDFDDVIDERDTYEEMTYDSSDEPAIPRKFFFTEGFDYETADITALNQAYLDNLNPDNPFLNPTEKLIQQGFEGTPYKYEPQ